MATGSFIFFFFFTMFVCLASNPTRRKQTFSQTSSCLMVASQASRSNSSVTQLAGENSRMPSASNRDCASKAGTVV